MHEAPNPRIAPLAAVPILLLSLLGLINCERERQPSVATSLIDMFPLAEVRSETEYIDFGSPEAAPHLLEGWGPSGTDESYVWAIGDHSVLVLEILEPRSLKLLMRCWPLRFQNAPPQVVTVYVNGKRINDFSLQQRGRSGEYSLVLPAEVQVRGTNRIEFRYSYYRRPIDVLPGSADKRPLAVAWDFLRIDGVQSYGNPQVKGGDQSGVMVIPYRTAVDYYFDIAEGGVIEIQGVLWWGESGSIAADLTSTLQVGVWPAGASREELFELSETRSGGSTRSLKLPPSPEGPVRISFRANIRKPPSEGRVGLQVVQPILYTKRPVLEQRKTFSQTPNLPREGKPNIIIYLVDTLRADHLGCYGYPKGVSPNIDAFAADAVLFQSMVAQTSWTRSAVASIFTGLYPQVHGVIKVEDALPDSVAVLPEILQKAGYNTAAVVTNGHVSPPFGFGRGFQAFRLLHEQENEEVHALSDRVNEVAFNWLEQSRSDRQPFFLYLHASDPHDPYVPRSPFREKFASSVMDMSVGHLDTIRALEREKDNWPSQHITEDLKALYDAEIAFNDANFGELINKLKVLNLYDSSVIIFLSDHGEEFFDHGWWTHGKTLFSEQLHVPFIIKFPASAAEGKGIAAVARQIDILPTVLDYLGLEVPSELQGSSLLPLIESPGAQPQNIIAFAYLNLYNREVESVMVRGKKLVHYLHYPAHRPRFELYNLMQDPEEQANIIEGNPIWAGYLRSLLVYARTWRQISAAEKVLIDEDLQRTLRALGYVQ